LCFESSFQQITKEIIKEFASMETRQKYSMGFTTKEEFHAAITKVVDQFAELQERDHHHHHHHHDPSPPPPPFPTT
jgi:hypothetical protein